MIRVLIIALCAQCLVGCFYMNKVEPERGARVTGIAEFMEKKEPVRILIVHGMGDHKPEYSFELQNHLAAKLGFDIKSSSKYAIERKGLIVGWIVVRVSESDAPVPFRFVELTWSPLTTEAKETLLNLDSKEHVEKNQLEDGRALMNSKAKAFINEKFTDAVLYAGQLKPTFNDIVAEAICALSAESIPRVSSDKCFKTNRASQEAHEIILVSQSLGSAIVFDTIENLSRQAGARQDAAHFFVANMNKIYFLANQLPLIEMTEVAGPVEPNWLEKYPCRPGNQRPAPQQLAPVYITTDGPSGVSRRPSAQSRLEAFLNIREEIAGDENSRYKNHLGKLEFISLSDPNDLLTYWLTARFKKHCESNNVSFVNVQVRNARFKWLAIFANPVRAHTGFYGNDKVIDFMVNGNDANR